MRNGTSFFSLGALTSLVLAVVVAAPPVWAATYREVFRQASPSVVIIHVPGEVGSGTFIDAKGLVLTASHVVQAAEDIEVEFQSGEKVSARVLNSEQAADVALLQLTSVPANAVPATLGDSDRMEVGDEVVVIGAPMGVSYTLTHGIISARRKARALYRGFEKGELFQTDAAINPGNSGGPLLNLRGEVVGVVSHILTKGGGSEGLGFAVTVNSAKRLLLNRRAFWGGLEIYPVEGEVARILNLPQPAGFAIKKIAPHSPGAKAKLEASRYEITFKADQVPVGGDIILAVGGIEVSVQHYDAIRDRVGSLTVGDTVLLRILREGHILTLAMPVE
jgi:serine protease Do